MNEDMVQHAVALNPAFLLNAVFTPQGKFARFFAGHWHEAWLAGCKEVERIYGIAISQQADLTIASAGGTPATSICTKVPRQSTMPIWQLPPRRRSDLLPGMP